MMASPACRLFWLLAWTSFLSLTKASPLSPPADDSDYLAPFRPGDLDTIVPNEFSVGLSKGYTLQQHWATIGQDLSATGTDFWYQERPNIYWVTVSDESIIHEKVRRDRGVKWVEMNHWFVLGHDPARDRAEATAPLALGKRLAQEKTGWDKELWNNNAYRQNAMVTGGDKLDHLDNDSGYPFEIMGGDNVAGAGVDIYVLDGGMRLDHSLFRADRPPGGDKQAPFRTSNFHGLKPEDRSPYCTKDSNKMYDGTGHGTHIASVAADWFSGIAPVANIINVKVLCRNESSYKNIGKAIRDVTAEHLRKKEFRPPGWKGSVMTMSFGNDPHPLSPPTEYAEEVLEAYAAGIPMIAAAGNEGTDASTVAPCALKGVFCVGAVDQLYRLAFEIKPNPKASWWSNYGPKVRAYAPGIHIVGADAENIEGGLIKDQGGTSLAVPLVAGMAATFISNEGSDLWDTELGAGKVYQRLVDNTLEFYIEDLSSNSHHNFATTGINHKSRGDNPYVKIDRMALAADQWCTLNITQYWDCAALSTLWAQVKITDAAGKEVYKSPAPTSSGLGLNITKPYVIEAPGLRRPLTISAQRNPDYVHFRYGNGTDTTWTASLWDYAIFDNTYDGSCAMTSGNWPDPARGPDPKVCQDDPIVTWARDFTCRFPCGTW